MLPLQGSTFPNSNEALREALTGGFTQLGVSPRQIAVEGAEYPRVERLRIDLTAVSVDRPPPNVKPGRKLEGELQVRTIEFEAKPIIVSGAPVQLRLDARDAVLREASAEGVDRVLALQSAAEGKISAEIQRLDLQRLVFLAAKEAARQRGVEIVDLKLELTASGGRTVEIACEVVAKFGFVKTTLHLTGRAALDEALLLHLSNLEVKGSGMAAGLATSFIRPQLEKVQREPIALAALSLGEVKIRDVRVTTGETVRLEAEFGR